MVNIALENSTNLWKYGVWYTFNIGLIQNLGYINVCFELWAQLFQENLGTCRLAKKLEGTLPTARYRCEISKRAVLLRRNDADMDAANSLHASA